MFALMTQYSSPAVHMIPYIVKIHAPLQLRGMQHFMYHLSVFHNSHAKFAALNSMPGFLGISRAMHVCIMDAMHACTPASFVFPTTFHVQPFPACRLIQLLYLLAFPVCHTNCRQHSASCHTSNTEETMHSSTNHSKRDSMSEAEWPRLASNTVHVCHTCSQLNLKYVGTHAYC